jgi:hypothetical protein
VNPAPASPDSLPPLGLIWGIKRSFIDYIGSLPDGSVSAADGASVLHSGLFCFAPDDAAGPRDAEAGYSAAPGTGVLRFRGDVRLGGHHGMLLVRLLDPWVTFTGGTGVLSISTGGSSHDRTTVAFLRAAAPREFEGFLLWEHVEVVISPEGSELFDGQYAAGQPMDPLTIHVRNAGTGPSARMED